MIRLAAVAPNRHVHDILHRVCDRDGVELVLQLGERYADLKASSLTRINGTAGQSPHPMRDDRYMGSALALIADPAFRDDMRMFVDHLHRRDPRLAIKPHPMATTWDYLDYFHILVDMAARLLGERRASHLLLFNLPHLGYDTAFYLAARILGLKVLILSQSAIPDRFLSCRAIEEFGDFELPEGEDDPAILPDAQADLFYMKGIAQEPSARGRLGLRDRLMLLRYAALRRRDLFVKPGQMAGLMRRMAAVRERLPDWRDPFADFFHEDRLAYFETIAGFEAAQFDYDRPFVYVPLQFQPEMTTSAIGGGYSDQALAIEALAARLPADVAIFVKENPKQGAYMRGPLFWHRLNRIENLHVLPCHANSHELIARSQFVATITGTAAWEAVRMGKRALVFGRPWFLRFPGIHRFDETPDLAPLLTPAPDPARVAMGYRALFDRCHEGLVDEQYKAISQTGDLEAARASAAEAIHALLTGQTSPTFGTVD